MKRYILIFIIINLIVLLYACAEEAVQDEPKYSAPDDNIIEQDEPDVASGKASVSFMFEHQPGWASNQFAVWIEDPDGNYIQTLYATQWTAKGGWQTRPDSLVVWTERSGLASKTKPQIDAIAGATPKTGHCSYSWDLTDKDGNTVSPGEYKFFAEGTLRWKNYVLYSGAITIGGQPNGILLDPEYFYEASDGQEALTSGSPENGMLFKVSANFTPFDND